jgi:hypothetical protein
MKFPMLEAMRAARERREQAVLAPVVEPLRHVISVQGARLQDMETNLESMSKVITSEIGRYIVPEIRDGIAQRIETEIYKAMSKVSGRAIDEVVTIPLTMNEVRFMRPDALTAQILDRVDQSYRKDIRMTAISHREQYVTRVRVTLPKVEMEIALAEDALSIKRRA